MPKLTKEEKRELLARRYARGVQDIDTRRTRQNGWNDVIDAYMGKLPSNWPFLSVTTDPRIRTAVLEKTSRLLNAKLQGRLVPREGGDMIKARINNALLDFQWDFANEGGSMIEKVAWCDQITRLFGAAFVLVYWDNVKNSNEIKVLDPRDVWFDGGATHIRNAKYVQMREWTSWEALERRGYDVSSFKSMIKKGNITSDRQDRAYDSPVKSNRNLDNRVGEEDDPNSPVVEVVTQWTKDSCILWLPKYDEVIKDGPNPYEHGQIPISMLRYYPLGDDIWGESEVECVMPLQRAIWATLAGYIDEMMISIRPPLKLMNGQYRKETIEYGPGAQWIVNRPDAVTEAELGQSALAHFNTTYPALIAAFNTALGDNSLGVSNVTQKFGEKTATEVKQLELQQNNRDQYNQLYLGEFLKDIMMMWLSNNKQYLLDDPTKEYHVIKIIGRDNIQYFQQMKLNDRDVPDYAMQEIADTVMENPDAIGEGEMESLINDLSVPVNPIVTNSSAKDPEKYNIKSKFDVINPDEAELYVTRDDFDGQYDYVPDVKSMAVSAGQQLQQGRRDALELILRPEVQNQIQMAGNQMNIKELIVSVLEDAGYKDAEGLFEKLDGQGQAAGAIPGAAGAGQAGPTPIGNDPNGGVPAGVPAVPFGPGTAGLPQPQGVPGQGQVIA